MSGRPGWRYSKERNRLAKNYELYFFCMFVTSSVAIVECIHACMRGMGVHSLFVCFGFFPQTYSNLKIQESKFCVCVCVCLFVVIILFFSDKVTNEGFLFVKKCIEAIEERGLAD